MIYCDTSLLVTAVTPEQLSFAVQTWLKECPPASLAISGWVVAEFASAIALKVRIGDLNLESRALAENNWLKLRDESLTELVVPVEAWGLAANFARRHQLGLRAGDALHLAVASLGNHSVATLDRGMATAALELGIVVEKIRAS